jgi:hypothetical protein
VALDPPQDGTQEWLAGGLVAETGDLALVSHEPDEPEPRPFANRPGKGKRLRRGEHRRAPRADVSQITAENWAPGNVEFEADADVGVTGAERGIHNVQMSN